MEDLNQNLEIEETESLFDDEEFNEEVEEETSDESPVDTEEESLESTEEETSDESPVDTEEESLESTEEETDEEDGTPTSTDEEETSDDLPFLKVKFNSQEKDLTREEAVMYAQKGMNYDHLDGKYQSLYSNITQLAAMNGLSPEEYLHSLESMQTNFAVQQELNTLKEQNPDTDENILAELAKSRVNQRLAQERKTFTQKQTQSQQARRSEIARQIEKFEERYPNLKADKLDDQVYELMKKGYTLLEAYDIYKQGQDEIARQEAENKKKIEEANKKNKKKSLGNTGNNEDLIVDDFLAGFNS